MIPHTFRLPGTCPETRRARLPSRTRVFAGPSAELLDYERRDPSTEVFGLPVRRSLGEHPHERLRARRPDENTAAAVQLGVHVLEAFEQAGRKGAARDARQVLLHLRVALHDPDGVREPAPAERPTEKERGRE